MDSDDDDEPPILIDMANATAATPLAPPLANEVPEPVAPIAEATTETENLAACPVTILSGFLGSGKTTLIQYILKSPDHGKRIAVIENEFGEGLAVETLIARDGVDPQSDSLQDFIELPNGCICCTVKDSLVSTLETLIDRKTDLDYILIEASGMANPGPIASVFWLDDALDSRLQLDGIVTLVDAQHILQQLQSTEEAAQQIAYADRLILNKTDLLEKSADSKALKKVEEALREIHPTAPIQQTTFSQIPNLDWILNANCFGGASRLEELDRQWQQAAITLTRPPLAPPLPPPNRLVDGDAMLCVDISDDSAPLPPPAAAAGIQSTASSSHRHTDSITTIALHEKGSLSLQKLNAWLADLLWPDQDESNQVLTAVLHDAQQRQDFLQEQKEKAVTQLLRVKGIVSVVHPPDALLESHEIDNYLEVEEVPSDLGDKKKNATNALWRRDKRRYIVQAVHDLWEVYPASNDLQFDSEEEREGKLVVIGKHLPREKLREGFASCFIDPRL